MVDGEWLRHLAGAVYTNGRWRPADPEGVQRLLAARVDESILLLQEEARVSAELHNEHAPSHRGIRYLPLPPRMGGVESQGGFLLLQGRAQLAVEYKLQALVTTLTVLKGFTRSTGELHRFLPHADPFGGIAWSRDNALLMTTELIIKRLFEDLTRAALEAGDIAGHK